MKTIDGLVQGPFKQESDFKAAVLKKWRTDSPWITRFEIENEDKAPGMPDCLSVSNKLPAFFTEFKISDSKGVIKFQKTQPLFYKQNSDLLIDILAWDAPRQRVVSLAPSDLDGRLKRAPSNAKLLLFVIPEVINDVEAVG
jgi:hypothetical protein